MRFRFLAALALITATAHAQHVYSGCQLFPTDAVFNNPVNTLPVSTNPAAQLPSADLSKPFHPVFGATAGFRVNVVTSSQAMVPITGGTLYWSQAPVPTGALTEDGTNSCSSGGDCHLIVLQQAASAGGSCDLFEAFHATINSGTNAGWNVTAENMMFNLGSNQMPPQDNPSADAAASPILPLLVTAQDIAQGHIDHMLAITVPSPPEAFANYLWPAAGWGGVGKCTGGYTDANSMLLDVHAPTTCPSNGPANGTVYRRKASAAPLVCVTAGTCPQTAMVEAALTKYGAMVIDNGNTAYFGIEGEFGATFDDTDLHNLTLDLAQNLEPVEVSVEAADLTAPIGDPTLSAPVTTYKVKSVISTGTTVIVTATYNGVTLTASAVVNPAPAGPSLASLSITPSTLIAGQTSTVTITLNGPAPTGGATITLASNSAHFPVPSTITIPAGSTSTSFTVTTD